MVYYMPTGESGRIVLEVDPDLKRRLYSSLALDHKTMKDWFIVQAQEYVASHEQGSLFGVSTSTPQPNTEP